MRHSFKSASTTAATSESLSASTEMQAGVVLGEQFQLQYRLSSGGMGTVWVAEDLWLKRRVAIKFIAGSQWDKQSAQYRFEREAVLAGKLRSPHVVRIFARGHSTDGRPYIVMELLAGEDLANRIAREGALDAEQVLCIVEQTTRALSEAHRQGLVHRDIKPHNIFLVRESDASVFVKLLDFGVAKDTHALSSKLTLTGAFIGTLLYVSPEQLTDPRRVGASADVWGLAVTTYQMLTGAVPFDRSCALPELLMKISRGEFVPATAVHPGLPSSVDVVFQRAFLVNPQFRFRCVEDFSSALADSLKQPNIVVASRARAAAPIAARAPSVARAARSARAGLRVAAFVIAAAVGWGVTRYAEHVWPAAAATVRVDSDPVQPAAMPGQDHDHDQTSLALATVIADDQQGAASAAAMPEPSPLPPSAAETRPLKRKLPATKAPYQQAAPAGAGPVNYGF